MLTENHSKKQGLCVDLQGLLDKQTKPQNTQQVAQLTLGIDSYVAETHFTVNTSRRVQSTAIPKLFPLSNQSLQHMTHSRASNSRAKLCIVVRLVNEAEAATIQVPTINHNSFALKGNLWARTLAKKNWGTSLPRNQHLAVGIKNYVGDGGRHEAVLCPRPRNPWPVADYIRD